KIKKKLSDMTQTPIESIKLEMDLAADLGLDSLDNAELIAFLDDEFEVTGVPVNELTAVDKLMAIAANQITFRDQTEEELADLSLWNRHRQHHIAKIPPGETLPEVFLNCCEILK